MAKRRSTMARLTYAPNRKVIRFGAYVAFRASGSAKTHAEATAFAKCSSHDQSEDRIRRGSNFDFAVFGIFDEPDLAEMEKIA